MSEEAKPMPLLRDRPYEGQPSKLDGKRGATKLRGITYRDVLDCFMLGACMSAFETSEFGTWAYWEAQNGQRANITEEDIHKLDWSKLDPMAVFQNTAIELEKRMGIYPNIPNLKKNLGIKSRPSQKAPKRLTRGRK